MKKRLIALLLCLVMLVTCMGVGVFMPPDIKLLSESGEEVSSVSVPQSDRVQLTTDYKSSGELGYQWQLSADGKTWINIYGQTGESVQLSYAMVCNMLNDEGTAQVRCMVTDGESEYASRAAEVSVDYSAPARPAQAAKAPVSVAPVSNPAPASEGDIDSARYYRDVVYALEYKASHLVNALETHTAAEFWPYPTYADILFSV